MKYIKIVVTVCARRGKITFLSYCFDYLTNHLLLYVIQMYRSLLFKKR